MADNVKPYNLNDSWDNKYTNGDDLWYALNLVKDRVLSLPKGTESVSKGLGYGLTWHTTGVPLSGGLYLKIKADTDLFDTTTLGGTLSISDGGMNIITYSGTNVAAPIVNTGSTSTGPTIGLNIGKGLYVGNQSQSTSTYEKLTLKLYNKKVSGSDLNFSGLEFIDGDATDDGANEYNLLRIKLVGITIDSSTTNSSGLVLEGPTTGDTFSTTGGLRINYGTGLTLGQNGELIVDSSAIVPNITGTSPIDVTTSGNNKVISLNSSVAGNGLNMSNGVIDITPDDGIILSDLNNRVGVRIPSSNTALYFKGSTSHQKELDVRVADGSYAGVTKLYTSVTNVSDTNTDGTVTQQALNSAYNSLVSAIGNLEGVEFKIAASLPTASETYKRYIYLIPISGASAPDAYSEYVCINKGTASTPNWAWEKIGDTNIDLSGYVLFTDNLGSTQVSAIVSDVFGY